MLSNKQRRKLNNFLSIIAILSILFFCLVTLTNPTESIECKKSKMSVKYIRKIF